MAKKVFIGVGHGGSDPGAVSGKYKEKDLNLSIAKHLKTSLERCGFKVGISRTKDENDRLVEEIKECNKFNPDLAVEIHNNAGGGDGAEVYYYSGDKKGLKCAKYILNYITKLGQKSRGAKGTRNFGWVTDTKATAVLCECAFVDSSDVKIIDTEAERKTMAQAIAKGICKYFGVKYVAEAVKNTAAQKVTITKVYVSSTALVGRKPNITTGYIAKILTGKRNPYLITKDKAGKSPIGWTRKAYIK